MHAHMEAGRGRGRVPMSGVGGAERIPKLSPLPLLTLLCPEHRAGLKA